MYAAGVKGVDPTRGLRFESTALTVQAAVNGLGVAVCPSALVTEDVANGRPLEPFDLKLANDWAYYLVVPTWRREQKKSHMFRRWLLGEAGLTAKP